jgi:hypothetical protein
MIEEQIEQPKIYFLYISNKIGTRKIITMRTTPKLFDKTTEFKIPTLGNIKDLDLMVVDGISLQTVAIKPFGQNCLFWKAGSR